MKEKASSVRWILLAIPSAVLLGYAWLIADTYSPYLDWQLQFRPPAFGVAPEDVLGLGFFVPWLVVSLLFLFAIVSAMSAVQRRAPIAVVLITLYGALSVLDWFLYKTLERQLLAHLL